MLLPLITVLELSLLVVVDVLAGFKETGGALGDGWVFDNRWPGYVCLDTRCRCGGCVDACCCALLVLLLLLLVLRGIPQRWFPPMMRKMGIIGMDIGKRCKKREESG